MKIHSEDFLLLGVLPLIINLVTILVSAYAYIFANMNLLESPDGGRWFALIMSTLVFFFVACGAIDLWSSLKNE